jgi:two-component system capsular synthesis sensor histidine kinase RcsC
MRHILVIEDNEQIRRLLHRFLEAMGYDITVADSGGNGIDIFNHRCCFDLVLTDIGLPGIDGNEVAKQIRKSELPKTPIIAMTGFQEMSFHRELFDYVLIKPFKLEALLDTIGSYL